ncbi:hypothetical protein L6Q79_13430 [bacterium]|nr:hypothetical protein [bacterium]NUN46156.1 hypothetical protein [bacterium]
MGKNTRIKALQLRNRQKSFLIYIQNHADILILMLLASTAWYISNPYDLMAFNDPWEYFNISRGLFSGKGIVLNDNYDIVLPPGYPIFIGLLYFLTLVEWPTLLGIGIASYVLSAILMKKILQLMGFCSHLCTVGLMFFVFNSQFLIQAGRGYAELPMIFLFLSLIWASIIGKENKGLTWGIMLGMLWGILSLTKPEGILLGLVVISLSAFNNRNVKWVAVLCFIVLYLPYSLFLKNQTGSWQLSGKTYVNLVLGELNSPYQNPTNDNARYDVIHRVWDNAEEAGGATEYMASFGSKILERLPHNTERFFYYLISTYSWIGCCFLIAGVMFWNSIYRRFIALGIGLTCFYLFFFITPRVLTLYHVLFSFAMLAGYQIILTYINRLRNRWLTFSFYGVAVFFVSFQFRTILRLLLQKL